MGARQARCFGRKKTLLQLLMAATVANLTLVATKKGQIRCKDSRAHSFLASISAFAESIWGYLSHLEFSLVSVGLQEPAFRLDF